MNEFEQLWNIQKPWIHVRLRELGRADLESSTPPNSGVVVELDGLEMRDLDGLFQEFARGFHFPKYFGWNWPAFDECMGDLAWFPASAYLVVIERAESVLDSNPEERGTFLRIMNSVCAKWANSFALPGEFGGGEVPFNMVLVGSISLENFAR